MQKFSYIVIRILTAVVALLPWRVLYMISDALYFFCQRKLLKNKLLQKNIAACFPNKSSIERRKIACEVGRYWIDFLLESMKGATLSQRDYKKRVQIEIPPSMQKCWERQQHVMCWGGHYGNLELYSLWTSVMPHFKCLFSYREFKYEPLNQWVLKRRTRYGWQGVEQNKVVVGLERAIKTADTTPALMVLFPDQTPRQRASVDVDFFEQRVPFLSGPEYLADRYSATMFYVRMVRVKRGYYRLEFEEIVKTETDIGDRTRQAARFLERDIKRDPGAYIGFMVNKAVVEGLEVKSASVSAFGSAAS
jgi:Kdo2-lipid IVA lauroyltransferase/acyltransferase